MADWKTLGASALSDEYNAFIPAAGFQKDEIYSQRSLAALEGLTRHADIVYDERSGSRLDLYPSVPGAPLFVWIHGGYWKSSTKNDNIFVVPGLIRNGVAVASIDYTLAPDADIEEIVRQVRQSIAWLSGHGSDYGIDTSRIHVGGHSAGGHLTGMLCMNGWQADYGLPRDIIATALPISGLFDLAPLAQVDVTAVLGLTADQVTRNSPLLHVPEQTSVDLLTSVGGRESAEFRRQTEEYGDAWRARGHRVTAIEMPDKHHFDIILDLETPGNPLFDTLIRYIRGAQ